MGISTGGRGKAGRMDEAESPLKPQQKKRSGSGEEPALQQLKNQSAKRPTSLKARDMLVRSVDGWILRSLRAHVPCKHTNLAGNWYGVTK